MENNQNKKSKRKRITWILSIIFVLLAIFFEFGIKKIQYNYDLVESLPVSQGTKTRAFWYSLSEDKLSKLVRDKKIIGFNIDRREGSNVTVFDGEYNYSFNTRSGPTGPVIYVYPLGDTRGTIIVTFAPNGNTAAGVFDYGVLDEAQVDDVVKRGLKLYNQFIKDYENI